MGLAIAAPLGAEAFPGLSARERGILRALLYRADAPASNAEIIESAWSPGARVSARCLAVHICWLRRKVAPHRIVSTRPGYRFIPAQA